MASVCNDKNGTRRVTFMDGPGKHRSLRLGRVSRRQAESVRMRVEQLLRDRSLGLPHDAATIQWIKDLPEATRRRLESLQLIATGSASITLDELIRRFLEARTVKSGTMATYRQCTDSLILHFGASTPIDSITPAQADAWKARIASSGRVREKEGPRSLARATVAKRTNIAKAIFNKAKVWKLLATSPFEHLKAGSQSNPDRAHYISKEDTQRLLDACPDIQWQALIGVLRYAGLRCPSEVRELKWSDINWDQKSLTVRSPKTQANPHHSVRIVPVSQELQPILLALFDSTEEGTLRMVPVAQKAPVNIYAGVKKIIERAGLKPWPRLLQNLRASCATDWSNEYPLHESSKWLGHSPTVAAKHYLQSRDLHFKAVTGTGPWSSKSPAEAGAKSGATVAQKAAQTLSAPDRTAVKEKSVNP